MLFLASVKYRELVIPDLGPLFQILGGPLISVSQWSPAPNTETILCDLREALLALSSIKQKTSLYGRDERCGKIILVLFTSLSARQKITQGSHSHVEYKGVKERKELAKPRA